MVVAMHAKGPNKGDCVDLTFYDLLHKIQLTGLTPLVKKFLHEFF